MGATFAYHLATEFFLRGGHDGTRRSLVSILASGFNRSELKIIAEGARVYSLPDSRRLACRIAYTIRRMCEEP